MDIALFSVAHPNALPYFDAFLDSLANQTCKDFTLFLMNDGATDVEEITNRFNIRTIIKNTTGTPAKIRKIGIEWILRQGADIIVFADSDDYFMDNRIEMSKRLLSHNDIVFNELIIIGENIQQPFPMLKYRYKEGAEVSEHDIKYLNCMGLSNTAIRTKNITRSLSQLPDDIIAFDWAFFYLCLHGGATSVYTGQTATYYRQYENNIAAFRSFTEDQIMRGVQIKRDHYRFVSRIANEYLPILKDYEETIDQINENKALREEYCREVVKQSPPSPLWWETIRTLRELGL